MRSSTSRYSLLIVSALVLVAALSLWKVRRESLTRATVLLEKTRRADKELTFAATSTVSTTFGGKSVVSAARMVRAPHRLSLVYLSGDRKGLQSGYSDHWFWRRTATLPVQAYAEVRITPEDMAAQRFGLMMQNYHALWLGTDTVNGRNADIIELRPKTPEEGARGPIKRIWVDQETGLSTRIDNFNYQKQPVMSTVLSQIDLKPQITQATFMAPEQIKAVAQKSGWTAEEMGDDIAGVARRTGILISMPKQLPPGFLFDAVGIHHCETPNDSSQAAAIRFIDGINTLTIFAMQLQSSQKSPVAERGSCDFGPGTMIMGKKNNLQFLVVGDLPPAALQRVLDSTDTRLTNPPKN